MASQEDNTRDSSGLKHELRRWQIFFIVLTAVIGGGVFSGNGEALEIAGPAGFLTALIVFGLVSIAVLDGVSEFIQLFPVMNALPAYVKAFVDRDLSWLVGIAYWYTFASTFAAQNLAAANLSRYWDLSQLWQTLAFYVFAPIVVLGINMFGVSIFGWIESVSGILKLALAFGTAVALYVAASVTKVGNSGPVDDGFQHDGNYVENHPKAVCYAIPLVAFSYLGQEIFVVTAFEARRARDLRLPSQIMPYVVLGLYLLIGIGEALNVKWSDPHLPRIYGGLDPVTRQTTSPGSSSMVIIATYHAGYQKLAGFLNGCLIFSVLSASNTSLYVSSRTLHGLATQIPETNIIGRKLQWLKVVPWRSGVPAWALVASALAFCWLPFLQLKRGYPVQDLQTILAVSASISLVMVWLILCVAFIRYCQWLKLCKADVPAEMPDYNRNSRTHKAYTFFGFAQPFMAWLGLVGCLAVLAFSSATWWDTPPSFAKVAVAYAAPIILVPIWLVLKVSWFFRGHGWGFVRIDNDITRLSSVFATLEFSKPLDRDPTARGHSGTAEEAKGFHLEEYPRASHESRQDGSRTSHSHQFDSQGEVMADVSPAEEYPPRQEYSPTVRHQTSQQHLQQPHVVTGATTPANRSQVRFNTHAPPQPHMAYPDGGF